MVPFGRCFPAPAAQSRAVLVTLMVSSLNNVLSDETINAASAPDRTPAAATAAAEPKILDGALRAQPVARPRTRCEPGREPEHKSGPHRGESSAGTSGTITLAATEAAIAVTLDDPDADPSLLNCPNGIP